MDIPTGYGVVHNHALQTLGVVAKTIEIIFLSFE